MTAGVAASHSLHTVKVTHEPAPPKAHTAQPAAPSKPAPKPKPAAKKPPKTVASTAPASSPTSTAKTPKPAKVVKPSPSSKVTHLQPKGGSSGNSSGGGSSGSGGSGGSGSSSGSGSGSGPNSTVNYTSTNWAGYFASGSSYTSVSASWAAPSPTGDGSRTTADATWIGIGGVTSGDLIQIGTDNTVATNGTVSTEAFYELLPAASKTITGVTVSPGDNISASISEISAGEWSMDLTDETTGQSFSSTTAYASSLSSAEWIEEDPSFVRGGLVPFDNFGTVAFSGGLTTVGGSSLSIAAAQASSITLVDSYGNAVAAPSALSGGSFSVTHN